MISRCGTNDVRCWKQQRPSNKGGDSIVVALPSFEFVVILRPRNGYTLLVTAFCPGDKKRARMRREYEASGPFTM